MESGTTDMKENKQPELKRQRKKGTVCSPDIKQPKLSENGVIETKNAEKSEIDSEVIDSEEIVSQDTASQETTSQETESQDPENAAESDNLTRESDTDSDDSKTEQWAGCNNPRTTLAFLQDGMNTGKDPYELMEEVIGPSMTANIKKRYTQGGLNPYNPEDPDIRPWKLLFEIMTEPAPRDRLEAVTSIDHVVNLLKTSKNILIVTGAGVSVSCGIPDFRSRDGVYAKLSVDYPDLPDPSAMFDIDFFIQNPMPFFDFAGQLWPGNYTPSSTHKFIARLDQNNQLLRNFTQNIDTLEQVAGIKNVVQCHGSFAKATCMKCKKKYDADDIKERVMKKEIPYCDCSDEKFVPFVYSSNLGENPTIEEIEVDAEHRNQEMIKWKNQILPIIKPDIVFFGESLSDDFHKQIELDKDKADLLIVIGSSMKVRPVSLIPTAVDENVPQILINRERLKGDLKFDVELLGDGDDIINELVNRLDNGCENAKITETESIEEVGIDKYFTVGMKNCENKSYIFRGAEHVFEDRNRVAGEQSTESDTEDKIEDTENGN